MKKNQDCYDQWDGSVCTTPNEVVFTPYRYVWKKTLNEVEISNQAEIDGSLYVSTENVLYKFSSSGAQLSKKSFGLGSESVARFTTGSDKTIYVASYSTVRALNPDMSEKWIINTASMTPGDKSRYTTELVVWNSTIFLRSLGSIISMTTSGNLKWNFTTDAVSAATCSSCSPTHLPMALGNNGLIYLSQYYNSYIGSGSPFEFYTPVSIITALRSNGTRLWELNIVGQLVESPKMDNQGTIYVALYGNRSTDNLRVYAINPSGFVKWNVTLLAAQLNNPLNVLNYVNLLIGSDGVLYVGSVYGQMTALNNNGTVRWASSNAGSPVLFGGDGTIYSRNIATKSLFRHHPDGSLKYESNVDEVIVDLQISPRDETLFAVSETAVVYAIAPDGVTKFKFKTDSDPEKDYKYITISTFGTIYVQSGYDELNVFETDPGIFVRSVKSQGGKAFVFSTDVPFIPCDNNSVNCSQAWQEQYCKSSTDFGKSLQGTFCPLFASHPPYSCSRDLQRSLLESISLAYSFAELGYVVLMFLVAKLLWRSFDAKVATEQRSTTDQMHRDKVSTFQQIENPVYRNENDENGYTNL